jgi:prepilin-type N-terminal cleavage/methylation domain-containing protein
MKSGKKAGENRAFTDASHLQLGRDAQVTKRLSSSRRICRRGGFTLLEMLTTAAALAIVLGLMVSLSRHVRNASAMEFTKSLLRQLDVLMSQYQADYHGLPQIAPLVAGNADMPNTEQNEHALQIAAVENNRQIVALLLRAEPAASAKAFTGLSDVVNDESVLRDAWGTPIVYMAGMHPAIGMAPQNRRFFFSAGPDRKFLTQDDNLYSYEEGPEYRKSMVSGRDQRPQTNDK